MANDSDLPTEPSYPDIPKKLIHVPNDTPGKPDTIVAHYEPGEHHPVTFCEVDESAWAAELVRRWNFGGEIIRLARAWQSGGGKPDEDLRSLMVACIALAEAT